VKITSANIKIKRIKKEGQYRLSEVSASNKHLSKQKNANYFIAEKFIQLFAFFAERVSLITPCFLLH
jgi:hypothetical protein